MLEDIIRTKKRNTFQYQKQLIEVLSSIGATYFYQGIHEKTLEYYKTALDLIDSEVETRLKSSLYNYLGICYIEKYDTDMAFFYFQKALDIRKSIGDKRGIAQC